MGSPLIPVLANIFMGFHESKWLNAYNLNKPKFYLRYFDDILVAFDNKQYSLNFVNFLNNRHPSIKLTKEKRSSFFSWCIHFRYQESKSHTLRVLHHFHIRLV